MHREEYYINTNKQREEEDLFDYIQNIRIIKYSTSMHKSNTNTIHS